MDFTSLLIQKRLKEEFLVELLTALGGGNRDLAQKRIDILRTGEFRDYIRILGYDRPLGKYDEEALQKGKDLFGDINSEHRLFGITEEEFALWDKVNHIVINLNDFGGAVRMLNSIVKKGVKRLKNTDKTALTTSKQERAEWIESAHGEYLSMGANDPKAHFRWDYGKRYTLSAETIEKVDVFLKEHSLHNV